MNRQARHAAIVIVVAMGVWMGLQLLGGQFGWPASWALLFDLAAGAAFIWALIVLVRVWRSQE